jgi:chemotaxis protein histidine kinase CheA
MLLLCAVALSSSAESFRERLNAANDLLRKGDVQGALEGYRDLRVDAPESPELLFNMGYAKYQEALRTVEGGTSTPDSNPFEEALTSFEKAQALGAGLIRQDAAFNRANCLAQYAKHIPAEAEQDTLIDAYQQSISAYEDVLRRYPDHGGARKNLDHMRYLLKKMLQNPPPPPEEQEGKGENEPQEDLQQDEQQPPEQPPNSQEGDQQEQDQAQQEEQSEDDGQPDQESDADQQEQEQREQMQTASEPDTEQEEQKDFQAAESGEVPERQTIEALLQSLEDRDQLEQRSERRQQRQTRIRREWW